MNGIRQKLILTGTLFCCTFVSCLQVEEFVQEVFVYEPVGDHFTIAQLKSRPADNFIEQEIYVQGIVTSTDENGQYAQNIVFQDETGAINIYADLSSSNQLFPVGQKISVQCRGMILGESGGMLSLGASVSGEGLNKTVEAIGNRNARNSIFAVNGGKPIEPRNLSLGELELSSRSYEQELVCINNVFFQTNDLPFANEGGSSEQFRTLYDDNGESILLCTSDGSTMAGESLPVGKGSVTGIVTYQNGTRIITARSLEDFNFNPELSGNADIPGDVISDLIISEYYSNSGAYYIEITNTGNESYNLGDFSLASDTASDGNFTNIVGLDKQELGPFGIAIYCNSEASSQGICPEAGEWDPFRTNVSEISIDGLKLDGNSQVALLRNGEAADILSTTGKFNWAANRTLIRRLGIKGHSKPSDYTRADAGWINKISGYAYNCGYHRFYGTDPDTDNPSAIVPATILEVRNLSEGTITDNISITGRVTSDRNGGNVEGNVLFMQDASNRGIRIAFREGQRHSYDAGDEITIELYGTEMTGIDGVLTVRDAVISRSERTSSPNMIPEPIEASVSQIESLQSMYIFIKDVQIRSDYIGQTYGSEAIGSEDLFANAFYIKCLGSADFAGQQVSENSGTIRGIASKSGEDLVLMPRNSMDLEELESPRFTAITATPITVAQMKGYGTGVISDNVRITASVSTDNSCGNMPSDMIFVQDASDGFMLKLPEGNPYSFGQSLIIVLKDAEISSEGNFTLTPASESDIVAVGAPDPSMQPVKVTPSQIDANMNMLVTISDTEVSEEDRLKKFDGEIIFDAKGISEKIHLVTEASATWKGAYIPTGAGSITGLIAKEGDHYVIYPRRPEDLSGLPKNGTRLNGEKVVYFVPSEDPSADLFISETVIGDLDANGNLLASIARNKCNSKFIELYNPTGNTLDLHNYRVSCIKYNNAVSRGDIVYWQFPENTFLTPGRTVVFKYVSKALGTGTTSSMTNTLWPKGYTGDQNLTDGVTVDNDAVPGVILCLDARDYSVSIANSTKSFPSFDGNDILVVQRSDDGGLTWREIDRLFSLVTSDGTITSTKAVYPFLYGYQRKPGQLGHPGNVTDCASEDYVSLDQYKHNANDFESIQCNPEKGAITEWNKAASYGDTSDLGVHTFSIE